MNVWLVVNGQHLCEYEEQSNVRHEVSAVGFFKEGQASNVLSAGWSRRVNMYPDVRNSDHITAIHPEFVFGKEGDTHRDDITCMEYCGHHELASASYDGEIFLWMTASGKLTKRLPVQNIPGVDTPSRVRAIYCLVTIPHDAQTPYGPSLIACGANGVFFWNTRRGKHGTLYAAFSLDTTLCQQTTSSAMPVESRRAALSHDSQRLVVGDSEGYITVYNIGDYCNAQQPTDVVNDRPEIFATWRASHEAAITGVVAVSMTSYSTEDLVVTTCVDCRARLWTMNGQFVGTFGQRMPWDIAAHDTWQHPALPLDIVEADEAALRAEQEDTKMENMFNESQKPAKRRSSQAWGFGELDEIEIDALAAEDSSGVERRSSEIKVGVCMSHANTV